MSGCSLESLVPSLSLCRQLQAAGFPQDTAMVWYPIESPDKDGDKTEFVFISGEGIDAICAAPTAGELMQWLVAKYPACAFEVLWSDDEWEMDLANDLPQICQGLNSKEPLVSALAALVLEAKETHD